MYTNDEQEKRNGVKRMSGRYPWGSVEEKRMMERAIERYKDVTTKMNEISNYIANHPEESHNNAILGFILKTLKEHQKVMIAYLTDNGVNVEKIDITESE